MLHLDQVSAETAARILLALHWLFCSYIHLRYPEATIGVIARVVNVRSLLIPRLLGAYIAFLGAMLLYPGKLLTHAALVGSLPILLVMLFAHRFWGIENPVARVVEQANFAKTLGVIATTLILIEGS